MNFCMVTTFYPPYNFGGDGIFVQRLSRDLVEAGHHVEVVHCQDAWRVMAGSKDPEPAPEDDDGVVVHRLKSPLGPLSPLLTQQLGRPVLKRAKLQQVFDRGFDVVNFHNISLVGGPGILRMGDAAKLYTLHEHWWVCPTHILWKYTDELCERPACTRCSLAHRTPPQLWRRSPRWMARCLTEVDLILAPSRFTADRHETWMRSQGIDVPLMVVPEYSPILPPPAVASDLPQRYFLYVGRLTHQKGLFRLLDAFEKRSEYPLVLVGTGPAEAQLRARGLGNVRFAGHLPPEQLAAYYEGAVAVVMPSICAETFGLVATEALSCGTPVLSTRCGGPQDILSPEDEVGFLYEGEVELLERLDDLWNDPPLGRRLGEAGRARHRERYTPASYLERYLEAVGRTLPSRAQ